jgi:pimeloyl-ACP methyl ester carboxylesterase
MKPAHPALHPALDRPEVSERLFFPQPAWREPVVRERARDVLIPVAPGVVIGARYHLGDRGGPALLFFHGNGETVDDYDETAALYTRLGWSFLPADYRGYGHSTGQPSVSTMLADAHAVLDHARVWLRDEGCTGPLVVMGRSLGSASALELAAAHADVVAGLVIESGFAHSQTLLDLVGLDMERAGVTEAEGFRHLEKIAGFTKPTLVIHAENDEILPFADGRDLYAAAGAAQKRLLTIRGAGHNDIFFVGLAEYLQALRDFVASLG